MNKPPSPYVGLRAFEPDEAARFHGRRVPINDVASMLLGNRLVVLYGPSRVGKTSLLQAGVIPRLRASTSAQVLPVGRPRRESTFRSTAPSDANPFVGAVLSSWDPDLSPRQARSLTLSRYLLSLDTPRENDGAEAPLVAVVDDFEHALVDLPELAGARDDVFDQLAQALVDVPRLHLLLSLRQDAMGEMLPYESRLSRGYRSRYQLLPLGPDAALEAVTGPLVGTGVAFAPGVAERLVAQLRTSVITNALGEERQVTARMVEPAHLQLMCAGLWDDLPSGTTTITDDHLTDHGDVGEVLTSFCGRAVAEVSRLEGVPEPAVWRWLEETFITDHGTRGAAYEGMGATAGMPNAVAEAFEERWVLGSEKRSGSVWFELLHDGLIEPIREGRRRSGAALHSDVAGQTPDVYMRAAEAALMDGDLSVARDYASRAVERSSDDPSQAEGRALLGRILSEQGRGEEGDRAELLFAEAEAEYREAVELFDHLRRPAAVVRVLTALGRLYRSRDRVTEALAVLWSAVDIPIHDPDPHLELAQAMQISGQPVAALGHYTAVLDIAPGHVEARIGRAAIYAEMGEAQLALDDLDTAARIDPEVAVRSDVVAIRRTSLERSS